MIIRRHCYILAVAAAALLAACGTGRTGTKVTARDGSASAPKETTAATTWFTEVPEPAPAMESV